MLPELPSPGLIKEEGRLMFELFQLKQPVPAWAFKFENFANLAILYPKVACLIITTIESYSTGLKLASNVVMAQLNLTLAS